MQTTCSKCQCAYDDTYRLTTCPHTAFEMRTAAVRGDGESKVCHSIEEVDAWFHREAQASTFHDEALTTACQRLDTMEAEPTDFEANVLETVLRQKTWASAKQRVILAQMCEKYLEDEALACELRGQQRLFA